MGLSDIFGSVHTRDDNASLRARVHLLERRVEQLMELQGLEPTSVPPSPYPEVEHELASGNHIAAIKAYRAATGAGLRDAKEAIDAMHRARAGR